MPLADAIRLDAVRRQLTCRTCGTVADWEIDDGPLVDLREQEVDLRASQVDDAQDDVKTTRPDRRRQRK
jgi:hypothetical protein